MRLESVAKFHSPKSPMMSDSPRATASDSLSGTDVMAAMGMAQSQAGFGMAAFCGKHELSQNDKQKAINYLMQFAHKVSDHFAAGHGSPGGNRQELPGRRHEAWLRDR